MSLSEAFSAALRLLVSFDPEVIAAVRVSLQVSLLGTVFAAALGVPAGVVVGLRSFWGRAAVETLLRTLTAMPTVVVGLLTYALLSRRGFFGPLGLLYTPSAMVIGETVLAAPLVATLTLGLVSGADPRIRDTALTLGASPARAALEILRENRSALLAVLATTFGRLISELGIALMAGGNIRGHTRTMTTAIALETSKGEFALGFALGLVLLTVALVVNAAAARFGRIS